MIKAFLTTAASLGLAAVVATGASAQTNLLVNGSFETGDFSGWNYSTQATDGQAPVVIRYNQASPYPTGAFGESIPNDPQSNPFGVAPGNFGAYFLSDRTAGDSISQSVSLIPGSSYTVGFDYYLPLNGYSNPGNSTLTVFFAGMQVAQFVASTQTPGVWQSYSAIFTPTTTAPTGTLQFLYNAPGNQTYGKDFIVDALFVAATAELVPEPASWMMMVAGFGLMGTALRRKRTSVAFA